MASNKKWNNLVLPALLTGVFGYAVANFIGIGVGNILMKRVAIAAAATAR